MTGLPIDDAMVALVDSGRLDEGRTSDYIGRTGLLSLLKDQGYDGTGGLRELSGKIDTWPVETGRNGLVSTADLRAGVGDGRIMPTVRVYQSDWNMMMAEPDINAKRRMATGMRDLLAGPFKYYERRLRELDAVIDEIDQQQAVMMAQGPQTRPLLLDPVETS